MENTQHPTTEEVVSFSIKAFKGIEVGIGKEDPLARTAAKLEEQYPNHLILTQAGSFLHGYGRTAYALHILKQYKLQLVGTGDKPHLRIGFGISNFKRRLWPLVKDFGIPYVVSLGNQKEGYTVYVSETPAGNTSVLDAIEPDVMRQAINDLQQRSEINKVAARQLLENPDSSGFKLKSQAQELDTQILYDVIKMPRDIRTTFGELLLTCSDRIVQGVMAYGHDDNKAARLRAISADVDLLKFRLTQAQKLKPVRIAVESRVSLAVELGRLLGGVMRSQQVNL